jgi:predicted transcriptional regulator
MALGSREDIIVQLLEMSKNGSTKAKMKNSLSVSHTQLRKILAELVDIGLLQFVELEQLYITTHKGHLFLNKNENKLGISK